MTKKWWTKFLFLISVTAISVLYILPTFTKIGSDPKTSYPFTKKINLGLDLQGGLYLVMGVDFNKVFKEIADRQLTSIVDRFKDKTITLTSQSVRLEGVPQDDPRIALEISSGSKGSSKRVIGKRISKLAFYR
jgi:preprotein translocase subunit SecD